MNRVPYASAVGAIMYTMTCTRPDVAYALSVASRYLGKAPNKLRCDSTQAEYIAQKFISELVVVPSIEEPIPLLCDNNGAIAQAKEPKSHQKSKHVLRRYHLIREIIESGDVKIEKVDGKENAADPFTKALGITQFDKHKWEVE
ncbi:hypothetical protein AAG906_013238 [Vitis piasezkii]